MAFTLIEFWDADQPADGRVLMARFDSTTGALPWDQRFVDPVTGRTGIGPGRAR